MRIIVLGAGISGALACGYFRASKPKVFDSKGVSDIFSSHKAVMRIRDKNVGLILGTDLTEIEIRRQILFEGTLQDRPNIESGNSYSIKTQGSLLYRSISEEYTEKRYLIKKYQISDEIYPNHNFQRVNDGLAYFEVNGESVSYPYDVCISTIPMNVMVKKMGIDFGVKFKFSPIYVYRSKLNISSEVHQTIYVPDLLNPIYRATVEGEDLIVEAVATVSNENIRYILGKFGLSPDKTGDWEEHVQRYGKIHPIEGDIRKFIIKDLTDRYNIYSLGRFSIWRNIRVDNLIGDLEKISHMINISYIRRTYENKLN